mgnify:CR=1 FL=1
MRADQTILCLQFKLYVDPLKIDSSVLRKFYQCVLDYRLVAEEAFCLADQMCLYLHLHNLYKSLLTL